MWEVLANGVLLVLVLVALLAVLVLALVSRSLGGAAGESMVRPILRSSGYLRRRPHVRVLLHLGALTWVAAASGAYFTIRAAIGPSATPWTSFARFTVVTGLVDVLLLSLWWVLAGRRADVEPSEPA